MCAENATVPGQDIAGARIRPQQSNGLGRVPDQET